MIVINHTVNAKSNSSPDKNKLGKKFFQYTLTIIVLLVIAIELLLIAPHASELSVVVHNISKLDFTDFTTGWSKSTPVKQASAAVPQNVAEKENDIHVNAVVKEVQEVPSICQLPEMPSGCEATAAAMLIQWAGAAVDKKDVAKALSKGSVPVFENGVLRGGNPNNVFIGDPFSTNGYGVFHKPVADVVNSYLKGQGLDATGISFEDLIKIIDSGRPVIVWATVDMQQPTIDTVWYDEKGNLVTWIKPEHTFLLVGHSDKDIVVNDPYTGKRHIYSMAVFKERWEAIGRQAVTVSEKIKGKVVTTYITDLNF